MSKSIDNKVVSMEFDNSKFEKPAKESISTLDKLKEALHFKNVESGFEAMNHAVKKVTFDPLAKGLDTVYAKFTFFERFTIQLYDRLANKIIDTGKLIAKETFTAPISSGKSEYEEKMGSIQTIMASTGESLQTVNKYLNELNKYSDDTIYSFRDMTNNIGKFTNAGVKLEDAVAAIKGVSNEAALSGANANEASRAMYNFAQALSTGSVKLIDWKSIENANMATVEFKKQLLETAADVGTLTKTSEDLYKTQNGHLTGAMHDFNGQLKDEWLTSEVLIKTLKKYADTKEDVGKRATAAATEVKTFSMMMDTLKEALQSGWAESWEHIFGDFEKAKQLWTDLSRVLGGLIDRMSTARNTMLKFWNENGGRIALIDGIKNAWKALTSILGAVRDGFRTVFPPMTGQKLVDLTKRFEAFTAKLRPTPVTIDKVRRTFAGLFSVIGIVIDGFKALYNVLMPLVGKAFKFITGELLSGTRSLGDWLFNLRETIKEGRVFETVFGKVGSVLAWLGSKLKTVFLAVKDIVLAFKNGGLKEGFGAIRDAFADLFSYLWNTLKEHNPLIWIKDLGVKIAEAIYDWPVGKAVVDFLKKVRDTIANSAVWKFCVGVVNDFVDAVQWAINRFRGVDTSATKEFSENVEEGFHPLVAIKNFFVAIWNGILKVWEVVGPTIKGFGTAIKNMFVNMYGDIRQVVQKSDMADAGVFGAGAGLGMMMASIAKFVLDLSKTVKNAGSTVKSLKKLTDSLRDLFKAFKVKAYAQAIKDTAIALGILAASLFILAALPADAMARSTASIMLLFGALSKMMKQMSGINAGVSGIGKAGVLVTFGVQLALMAAAIGILVANMIILALIPYEAILKGMAVIVLMMRALTSEVSKLGKLEGGSKAAGLILAFAIFIQLLLVPLSLLSLVAYFNQNGLIVAAAVIIVFIAAMAKIAAELTKTAAYYGTKTVHVGGTFIAIIAAISGIVIAIAAFAGVIALLQFLGKGNSIVLAADIIDRILKELIGLIVILALIPTISAKFSSVEDKIKIKNTKNGIVTTTKKSMLEQGGGSTLGTFAPIVGALLGIAVGMAAIAGAFAVIAATISLVPENKITEVIDFMGKVILYLGVVAIIVAALGKRTNKIKASAEIGTGNKLSISLFPKLVSYILAASVMIVAVAAAAKIINGVDTGSIIGAIGVMGAVFALMAGLSMLTTIGDKGGFGEKFAKGLGIAGKAMTGFGKVVLIFIAVIGILLAGIALLIHTTDQDFESFTEMLASHKDDIIKVVTDIIEIALTAALRSVFTALQTLSVETIKGLVNLVDTLIDEGPELVARLLILIGVILDGIIDKAPEITEKLVQAIIAILHGLGTAIYNHSSEIVEAINKVLEGVTSVWMKGIGRLFGVESQYLDGAVQEWMGFGKVVTAAGIGVFAVLKKIKSIKTDVVTPVKDTVSMFSKLRDAIKGSAVSISYVTNEAGEMVRQVNNVGNIKTFVHGFIGPIKSFIMAHPFITIAAGIGIVAKKLIDSSTKAIKVITYNDKKVMESTKSVREETERLNEAISNRGDAFKNIEKETAHTELLVGMLREAVDENNKVKAGYEQRVSLISQQLAGTLNVELDAQTRVLSVINEQNEAIDIQSEKVDEMIKKKQLQAKMEKAEEQVSDIREKIDNGWYEEQIAAATQAQNDFKNALYTFEDAAGNIIATPWTNEAMAGFKKDYEEIKKEIESGIYVNPERLQWFNELDMYWKKGWITDAQVSLDLLDSTVSDANDNFVTAKAAVKAVDNAWVAMDGTLEQAQKAIEAIDFNLALTDAGASTVRLIGQFEQMTDKIARIISSGANVSEETKQKYRSVLDTLASELGASKEGQKYLNDVGYNAAGDYIDGAVKRLKEEASKNEELKKAGAGIIGNVWDGVVDGTLDNETRLKNLYALVGDNWVADAFAKELGIASPSKVFSKFGEYTILGLIQGVTKKENALEKTYSAMAAGSLAAYTSAMSSNRSSFAFTPMINSSGIQNGTAAIQSQLNSLSATPLGATLTSQLAASVDTSQIDSDNSKILKALTDLLGGVGDLGTRMENLQIVMDTGATVGALAPGMDLELGRRAVRKTRGV